MEMTGELSGGPRIGLECACHLLMLSGHVLLVQDAGCQILDQHRSEARLHLPLGLGQQVAGKAGVFEIRKLHLSDL